MQSVAEDTGRCMDGLFGNGSMENVLDISIPDAWAGDKKLRSTSFRESRRTARATSLPSHLPACLAETMKPLLASSVVPPPPMSVSLSKKKMQNAAGSSQRAALHDWLTSEEGRAWRSERDLLFSTPAD